MKNNLIIASAIALVLFGCSTTKHQMQTVYLEQDHEPYAKKGNSSITGQVFLKTRGGEVRYGAGETIRLFPATPYASEMFYSILRGEPPASADYRLKKYIKETVADGTGNYEFNNLPAGEYLLQSQVFWQIPVGLYSSTKTGGTVTNRTRISDGEHLKVMLYQ